MEKNAQSVILADIFKEFDLLNSVATDIQAEYLKDLYYDFAQALTFVDYSYMPDGLRLRNGLSALEESIRLFEKISKEFKNINK